MEMGIAVWLLTMWVPLVLFAVAFLITALSFAWGVRGGSFAYTLHVSDEIAQIVEAAAHVEPIEGVRCRISSLRFHPT